MTITTTITRDEFALIRKLQGQKYVMKGGGMRKLYAYEGRIERDVSVASGYELGGAASFVVDDWSDPGKVVLVLDDRDTRRWNEVREAEWGKVARNDFGQAFQVTDQATGDKYRIASAPCGGGSCHCAAVAVKM